MEKMIELLSAAGGSQIASAFLALTEAEEALAEAKRRGADVTGWWMATCPPNAVISSRRELYRSFVREIVGRMERGEDIAKGTRAEVLLALSEGTMRAPLKRDHAVAMAKIFAEVFGEQAEGGMFEPGELASIADEESYPGAAEEIIEEVARRMTGKVYRGAKRVDGKWVTM